MIHYRASKFSKSLYIQGSHSHLPLETQQINSQIHCRCHQTRLFSTSLRSKKEQSYSRSYFNTYLGKFSRPSRKIKWLFLVLGLGATFLALDQVRKNEEKTPKCRSDKREKIRPSGPWQVQVMSTLPLKAISRLWGKFNELELPYFLRVPGFKLYSYIFAVNLSEVSEPDLHTYPNLASFFYRSLKPGVRPLDPNQNALLSPADGRVLQFGSIVGGEVEQVKGITYSLDALLGSSNVPETSSENLCSSTIFSPNAECQKPELAHMNNGCEVKQDEEFAVVNGISYTLSKLFSGPKKQNRKTPEDVSTAPKMASEVEVKADFALGEKPWYAKLTPQNQTSLHYVVIYLAPGDYHRFHSPCAWIVQTRRHFAGELYSVSPYLQRTLPGLFTLNERVVLLGRWRWGFFSYVPVGATNVGSIKVNFDRELRTNSLNNDTAADRAADEAAKRNEPYCGFSEASYEAANPYLRGHSLRRGEEMGGFQLGSTIVLVFEAPKGRRPSLDEGWMGEKIKRRGGWNWAVERGQKIRVGEALGWVDEA